MNNQFKAATISCPDLDANLPDNLPPQSDTELERLPSPLSHFPGLHKVQHKQESIESIKTVSDTEFHKNHSYSDMEELDHGDLKQEYCMVQHCNHPVPKPRCTLPLKFTQQHGYN